VIVATPHVSIFPQVFKKLTGHAVAGKFSSWRFVKQLVLFEASDIEGSFQAL
jgi:hypothetical protein